MHCAIGKLILANNEQFWEFELHQLFWIFCQKLSGERKKHSVQSQFSPNYVQSLSLNFDSDDDGYDGGGHNEKWVQPPCGVMTMSGSPTGHQHTSASRWPFWRGHF